MKTKGKKATQLQSGLGLAVLALSLTVGCAQQKRASQEKSVGVIVKVKNQNQKDIQKLFPTNKVSVLDKSQGLFTISGATTIDAHKKLPNAYIENDKLINFSNPDLKIQKILDDDGQGIQCHPGTTINPQIQSLNQVPMIPNTNGVVRIGTGSFLFSATTGQYRSFLGHLLGLLTPSQASSQLKFRWVVDAPAGSAILKQSEGEQISVTPDRPGEYSVILLALDASTRTCEYTAVAFGATWSHPEPYEGPQNKAGTYSAAKFFFDPLIKADQAWNKSQGEGVTIAVIDSGVNYNHPELSDNIKINTNEIPGNGIDDDGDGFVDDVYGWNFVDNSALPLDDHSHGTHVAGLAAGESFGVARKAKILPIKALDATGAASTSNIIKAINYAILQKVDIINLSVGGQGPASQIILDTLKKAADAGILIVAASGNGDENGKGINTDVVQSHFDQDDGANVLAVAATDENGALTDYSNYGARTVGIAAPGGTESSMLTSSYAFTDIAEFTGMAGTSMASPIVAGAAAVVKSANPNLSYLQIKNILINTSHTSSALSGKVSGGLLDVDAAVQEARSMLQMQDLLVTSRH